jgi:flagellar hook protein FlgE
MSLFTSLSTATSGLQANSLELSVVGDNIANANTIGFKEGRAAFEDALLQQLIGIRGGGQLGLGTRLQAIQRLITQGAISQTSNVTDLAIRGSGYFLLRGNHSGLQGSFYTRDGQFTVDKDGYLTNLEGLRVQGYPADPRGVIQGALGDLQVGTANASANPTTSITIKGNLAADATAFTAGGFDPTDPVNTSNYRTTVEIYDSLGQAHSVALYYRKTAAGTWDFHALTDGGGLTGGTAGVDVEIASGTLTFDTEGNLVSMNQTSDFNPLGAVNPQPLSFDFGDPTSTGGTGTLGLTQFGGTAGVSTTTFTGQDGNGYGALSSVQINDKGEVLGAFTNGTTRVLGQVAIADFEAADKLELIGGNLAIESTASGQPTIGEPATGGRGSIAAGALEQSNVDLANEFVRMIAAQRGFQANSKTIQTADGLLAELMQLKR